MRSRSSLVKAIRRHWVLYLLIAPVIAYFIIFCYFPMYGVQIAFKNFTAAKGIWDSPWVGFVHFERFFKGYYFSRVILNTLQISLYSLVIGFPVPILLALMINEVRTKWFRSFVQTITYAPHFLSLTVVVGILFALLSTQKGIVNHALRGLGLEPIAFMTDPHWFKTVYVLSDIWQQMGWGSIIYLAALSGVDPQQHEAATIDGASRLRRIWHINVPAIMPTVAILFILNMGNLMGGGSLEKLLLMQHDLNLESSDVISTYVFRTGIGGAEYSFAAAVGLFNSAVNFLLLVSVNYIARKAGETSLW
ncbi:ABC transporter permease subunit [Paenibacillus aurantius]|uniref:ABC transporter permease subunit n=1 Tax=Paenibacillus aurantius TaxID=2918900 RepID=A0AA96RI98_9BACL|nr:ABC transporter permease subunit [Paenibacillus aurantius]WNQ14203.1 ABC transporter permease subunit [Paenibacillus aurantius]